MMRFRENAPSRAEVMSRALTHGESLPITEAQRIIATVDVVMGVWIDPVEDGGMGSSFIKGEPLFRKIAAGDVSQQPNGWEAILCGSGEEAAALNLVYGDRKAPE